MQDSIVQEGDPVLRKQTAEIARSEIGSAKLKKLIQKMQKALAAEEFGVAIAAPQVGAPVRLFIVADKAFLPDADEMIDDLDEIPQKNKKLLPAMVFINPKLIRLSKKKREMAEGCLSVRGKYGTVLRHEKATVQALNEKGKSFTYHGSGLLAHIFQHETDHLDGILYTDKAIQLEDEEERHRLRKEFSA